MSRLKESLVFLLASIVDTSHYPQSTRQAFIYSLWPRAFR